MKNCQQAGCMHCNMPITPLKTLSHRPPVTHQIHQRADSWCPPYMALRGLGYCFRLSDAARQRVGPHTSEGSLMEKPYVISNWIFLSCQPLEELIIITHKIQRSSACYDTRLGVQELFTVLWTKCINALLHRGGSKISFTPCGFAMGAEWVGYSMDSMLLLRKRIGEPNKKKKSHEHNYPQSLLSHLLRSFRCCPCPC